MVLPLITSLIYKESCTKDFLISIGIALVAVAVLMVSAVTAALNAFNRELLAEHIRTCVADGIRRGDEGTEEELIQTLRQLMR